MYSPACLHQKNCAERPCHSADTEGAPAGRCLTSQSATWAKQGGPHLYTCIIPPGGDDCALLRHGPDSVDAAALRHLAQVHDGRALLVIAVIIADVIVAVILGSLRDQELFRPLKFVNYCRNNTQGCVTLHNDEAKPPHSLCLKWQ